MNDRNGKREWSSNDFVDSDSYTLVSLEVDPWIGDARDSNHLQRLDSEPGARIDKTNIGLTNVSSNFDVFDDNELYKVSHDLTLEEVNLHEPELLIDPRSNLSEQLYPCDDSIDNLSFELRIDQFLANVGYLSKKQHSKCHQLLKSFGARQLSSLIPWLYKYSWKGGTLMLFLEFRVLWELKENFYWWETFHYSHHSLAWEPRYVKATLTLEHTLELVSSRDSCNVDEVIDHKWYADWEIYSPWKYGIRSFASFSVFRAGVSSDKCWIKLLEREDRRSVLETAQCEDYNYARFMLPSIIRQYGCVNTINTALDAFHEELENARCRSYETNQSIENTWIEMLEEMRNQHCGQ